MRQFLALLFVGILALNAPLYAKTDKGGTAIALNQTGINIASGVRAPGWISGATMGTTNTTQNFEAVHVNEEPVQQCSLALIYSGWQTTTTNETPNPNPFTITASIEYPPGTFNQVTWNNSTSLLIAPGANIISDYIPLSTCIPAYTAFKTRTWTSVAQVGYTWPSSGTETTAELCATGVGLADLTLGGTITDSGCGGYRPSAIISQASGLNAISFAGIGDSIMGGATDIGFDAAGNTGWVGRSATAAQVPFISMAVTGTTLANQIGHFIYRPDLLKKAGITTTLLDYGVNDVTGGTTLVNLEAQVGTIGTAVVNAGSQVAWSTITPRTTSTEKWLTTGSQTIYAGFTGGLSSIRSEFNAWLRTTPSPLFTFVEASWIVESSPDSAIWGTNTNGQNFNTSLDFADNWTASGTPSTTVIQSNSTRPSSGTSWYFGGIIQFTSGVDSGVYANVSSYTLTNGQFTVPALANAPSAGDTFLALPISGAPSNDGLHPVVNLNQHSGAAYGGIWELEANFAPQLAGWR